MSDISGGCFGRGNDDTWLWIIIIAVIFFCFCGNNNIFGGNRDGRCC